MSLRSDGPRRSPSLQKLESSKEPRREGTQKAMKNAPARAALRADTFQPPARKPVELSPTTAPRAAVATAQATPASRTVVAAAAAPEAAKPPSRGSEAANRVNDAYAKAPEGERARAAAEALRREAEALKDDPQAL
ncbi:MAG TPA: hypothetical protein VK458_31345, partial [Myxococcaceae bacterium]|nr:hypothetical protein [Myxococcaceae bacterium]